MRPLLVSLSLLAVVYLPLSSSAQGLGDAAKKQQEARKKNSKKTASSQVYTGADLLETKTAVPASAAAGSTSVPSGGSSTRSVKRNRSAQGTPSRTAGQARVYTGEDLLLGRDPSGRDSSKRGTISHPGGKDIAPSSPDSDGSPGSESDAVGAPESGIAAAPTAASATDSGRSHGRGRKAKPDPTPTPALGPTPTPPPSPAPTPTPTPTPGDQYFISPSGDDANDGRSPSAPFRTFARAFSVMPAGGTLFLMDGVYSGSAGTGTIHYSGTGSGQPRSGSASQPTQVRALNPGRVSVLGPLFLGRSSRKDSYIYIGGITFQGGGQLYNTSYVTVKDCGFHGQFSIGTNDHSMGNSRNLIEDVWIWAAGQRVIAINYRAHENVWRRVVVRGDGCGASSCQASGNPNVGMSVYDSHDVSLQNVIVLDRLLLPGDTAYADFATAQHTPGIADLQLGRNEWLGTISLKSPDGGYAFEADNVLSGFVTHTIRNAVAWDSDDSGFNIADGSVVISNITSRAIGVLMGNGYAVDGLRIAPEVTGGSATNIAVAGATGFGINSRIPPAYCNVFGALGGSYNQTTCSTGAHTFDALGDGSIRYVPRIEPGSNLRGIGLGGAEIGANVEYRYGRDGSRFGEIEYNALTAVPLWPWQNESRLKREMCEDTGVSHGFCAAASLSQYVWGYLGNSSPY